MPAPRSAGILTGLDDDGPDRSRARRLAQALMAAPGTIGPTDARGTMALLPGAAKTVGARYGKGILEAFADMATLGPFRRLNDQIAAADVTGTPRREAIDYGDVFGMASYPMAGGVTASATGLYPKNAFGMAGRGSFDMDYFGQQVRVLQNPSSSGLKGFLSRTKYKAARRIVDPETGDVYVWDAADPALHAHVAKNLGVDPSKMVGDVIGLED